MALLEAALDEIRPALHADGGDLVLHGVDDLGVVTVELQGACGTCPLSIVTLVAGIEVMAVSYTHLTLPTTCRVCRSRWAPAD